METNQGENKENCGGGNCHMGSGMCGGSNHVCGTCGHNHGHVFKWIAKIVLLIIVFCFAFQMGELKGMLRSEGGYGSRHAYPAMMYTYGTDYSNGAQGGTGIENGATAPSTPTPTTPAPTK